MIEYNCEHCNKRYSSKEEFIDRVVECTDCEELITIPKISSLSTRKEPPALPKQAHTTKFWLITLMIVFVGCCYIGIVLFPPLIIFLIIAGVIAIIPVMCYSLDYNPTLKKNRNKVKQKKPPHFHKVGKYTCPNCQSSNTYCVRDMGCAIIIILFVSCGLGLIMIPFLPHHCYCRDCKFNWKA